MCSAEKGVDFLQETLKSFLRKLCVGKSTDSEVRLKDSIGQAIMQAVRPRILIAPLQLGLGVQLHHHVGSRHLIETLYNLAFLLQLHRGAQV